MCPRYSIAYPIISKLYFSNFLEGGRMPPYDPTPHTTKYKYIAIVINVAERPRHRVQGVNGGAVLPPVVPF